MHLEKESSKSYIDLSEILTKVKEEEGVHKTERLPGINSTLMEESHHVKIQTVYSSDDPSMHLEEYNMPDIDLGKILTQIKEEEGIHKEKKSSGVNSTLMEESHRVILQTTYSKDEGTDTPSYRDLRMHLIS